MGRSHCYQQRGRMLLISHILHLIHRYDGATNGHLHNLWMSHGSMSHSCQTRSSAKEQSKLSSGKRGCGVVAHYSEAQEGAFVFQELQLLGGCLKGGPEGTLHAVAAKHLYPTILGAHLSGHPMTVSGPVMQQRGGMRMIEGT